MTDPIPSPLNDQPINPQPEPDEAAAGQPEPIDGVRDGVAHEGDKSAQTSALVQPTQPGLNGGTLRLGSLPGNTPGTGRPRKAWKEFCREAIEDPDVQAAVMRRAYKGQHAMLKLISDHGAGAPEQKITIGTDSGALDRLLDRLAPKPPEYPA